MSFSKAKLLRFNEIPSTTPSPADYTILNSSRVAGAIIPKSERFTELSSPASSDVSSHHSSSCNASVFRTPNPPPRLKLKVKKGSTIKPVELFQSEDTLDALKEKIVECNNKDQYINELMEQVEEMKQQLGCYSSQLSNLDQQNAELTKALEDLNSDKEFLLNDQQKHLSNVNEKLINVYNTHNKIGDVKIVNIENRNDLKTLLENINILDDLLESYKMINDRNINKLQEKDQQLLDLEKEYLNLQQKRTNEIDSLRQKYKKQIESFELQKIATEANFTKQLQCKDELICEKDNIIKKLQEEFEIEKTKLRDDTEVKIQQLTVNFKEASTLAEIQLQEKCKEIESNWQSKLEDAKNESDAVLKECQAIAEYNIIQCEIEKNQALYSFAECQKNLQLLENEYAILKRESNTLTEKYTSLLKEVSDVKTSKIKTFNELVVCKKVIDEMTKDKHKYEVTVAKTHALIDTLKNRLMDSDKDVEQLKAELEDTETSKLECEEKCNQLEEELQTVLKLFDNVTKDIKAAKKECEEKASQLERELHLKVDHFKKEADIRIVSLNRELGDTKLKLEEAMKHLKEQEKINSEAQIAIANSLREIENLKVCSNCTEMQEKHDLLLQNFQKMEQENEGLLKKIALQEALIGPFRDQLTEYEAEYRALMNQKHNAEQEAKEIGLKFAQILGHQNQKQKIKHLMDLKMKNYELSEKIKDLEAKNRLQSRTIEKLKKEVATPRAAKKKLVDNKENILSSPNRTLNGSIFEHIDKEKIN